MLYIYWKSENFFQVLAFGDTGRTALLAALCEFSVFDDYTVSQPLADFLAGKIDQVMNQLCVVDQNMLLLWKLKYV